MEEKERVGGEGSHKRGKETTQCTCGKKQRAVFEGKRWSKKLDIIFVLYVEGENTVRPYEMQMKKLICPGPFLAPNRVANPSERKNIPF